MNLAVIKEIVQTEMAEKHNPPRYIERSTKYAHGQRVASLVLRLRKLILPDKNEYDDILTVAAWCHDICHGVDNHWTAGAKRTKIILNGYCTPQELEQICSIIAVHDDRKPDSNYSDLIKIHQDADLLDHLGALEIWLHAAHIASRNGSITNKLQYFLDTRPTEVTRWRDELNYDVCKPIYDDKIGFAEVFMKRLAVEYNGGIWNEEALLP